MRTPSQKNIIEILKTVRRPTGRHLYIATFADQMLRLAIIITQSIASYSINSVI